MPNVKFHSDTALSNFKDECDRQGVDYDEINFTTLRVDDQEAAQLAEQEYGASIVSPQAKSTGARQGR